MSSPSSNYGGNGVSSRHLKDYSYTISMSSLAAMLMVSSFCWCFYCLCKPAAKPRARRSSMTGVITHVGVPGDPHGQFAARTNPNIYLSYTEPTRAHMPPSIVAQRHQLIPTLHFVGPDGRSLMNKGVLLRPDLRASASTGNLTGGDHYEALMLANRVARGRSGSVPTERILSLELPPPPPYPGRPLTPGKLSEVVSRPHSPAGACESSLPPPYSAIDVGGYGGGPSGGDVLRSLDTVVGTGVGVSEGAGRSSDAGSGLSK